MSVHNKSTRGEKSRTCQEIKAVLLSSLPTWIVTLNWQKLARLDSELRRSSHKQTFAFSSSLPPEQKSFLFANSHLTDTRLFLSCQLRPKSWPLSQGFFKCKEWRMLMSKLKRKRSVRLFSEFWCACRWGPAEWAGPPKTPNKWPLQDQQDGIWEATKT